MATGLAMGMKVTVDDQDPNIKYSPEWTVCDSIPNGLKSETTFAFTKVPGATASYNFTGKILSLKS